MRVLISTVNDPLYMMPPLLSDEQVICGPDWSDSTLPDGRVVSMKTPEREYNLNEFVKRLPTGQEPEIVVCIVDASLRNLPRNLSEIKCPKVLFVADTHHMSTPITIMLSYMTAEKFDRIIMLYDRQHINILRGAGFGEIFWFPGLTFPHDDTAVMNARKCRCDSPHMSFVGQYNFHPRRKMLLDTLSKAGLQVDARQIIQRDTMNFYASSGIGFNASLNGDFNLRVFEILASGAALITDSLSSDSGMNDLFPDGREMIVYKSPEELAALASKALADPVRTRSIGSAGAAWIDRNFSLKKRREYFSSIVFDGVQPDIFPLPQKNKAFVFSLTGCPPMRSAISVYEEMQELHRNQDKVLIRFDASVPADIRRLFATLPRVAVGEVGDGNDADLVVLSSSSKQVDTCARLWFWDAGNPEYAKLNQLLSSMCYTNCIKGVAMFMRDSTKTMIEKIDKAIEEGNLSRAVNLVKIVISMGNPPLDVILSLASMAERVDNKELFEMAARMAYDKAPDNPQVLQMAVKAGITSATVVRKNLGSDEVLEQARKATRLMDLVRLTKNVVENPDLSYDAKMQLLMQVTLQPLAVSAKCVDAHKLPCTIVAVQPWFGLDYVKLVERGLENHVLVMLFPYLANKRKFDASLVTLENFRTYRYKNLPLWPMCHYGVCYKLGVMPEQVGSSPDHLSVVRKLFCDAVEHVDWIQPAYSFYRPDSVIIAQGYDILGAVFRIAAATQGVRVVALENIFRKDRLLWDDLSGITVNRNAARNFYWRYAESVSGDDARKTVESYFNSINQLKSLEHSTPDASKARHIDGSDAPTLLYLAQVGIDSSVLYGRLGFESQAEIITTMAEFAFANGCRLVVKLHPKESTSYKYSEPAFRLHTLKSLEACERFMYLKSKMGEALILDSENALNTYDLIRSAALCATLNSQSGLEALALGREVIICGQAFYGGLGFTFDAPDAASLMFYLKRIVADKCRRNNIEDVDKFFHIFTNLFCLPKTEESLIELAKGGGAFRPLTSVTE